MDLILRVYGRPAPEGSHETGQNGYVMHSSAYLQPWRSAVKGAAFRLYRDLGIAPAALPLIPYPFPCWVTITHYLLDDQCRAAGTDEPTGKPDGDKLLRGTIDGLGEGRVFGDDSQILGHRTFKARGEAAGALIQVTAVRPWWAGDENREIQVAEQFIPNGQFQLVLSAVGTNGDGDRTWETVIDVTDTPESIVQTWMPGIAERLWNAPASLAPALSPSTETKPQRGRPRKATAAPAEPAAPAPEAPAAPEVPAAPPAPATVATAPAPIEVAQRVNPFARPA